MNAILDLQAAFKNLYLQHWPELAAMSAEYGFGNAPFLMCPPTGYLEQPRRLMLVGKEANDREPNAATGLSAEPAVATLMDQYLKFDFGAKDRSTCFWQGLREVARLLHVAPGQILWTNVNKIAPAEKPPSRSIAQAVLKRAPLLQPEIELAKPDVVVFFSGPDYDRHLRLALPEIEFVSVEGSPSMNVFCRLVHPSLPQLAFRTYHPNGLRQAKQERRVMDLLAQQFERMDKFVSVGGCDGRKSRKQPPSA